MNNLFKKLSLENLELKDKRVLIRVDYNVPLDEAQNITNTQRIEASLPTLNHVLSKEPRCVVLISHLGRPNGKVVDKYSLRPVASALEKLLNRFIQFYPECTGEKVETLCNSATNGQIILLENLRFHIEEEGSVKDEQGIKTKASQEKIQEFRNSLSRLGQVYINDAFGTCHRAHSSLVGISLEQRACGFLVKKELEFFSKVLEAPQKPFVAIIGGAKIADKIPLIENLIDKVDCLVIGGGMTYTFLKTCHGVKIGNSIFDEKGSDVVENILKKAAEKNVQVLLPIDHVVANKFSNDAKTNIVSSEQGIPDNWMGMDIGPQTSVLYGKKIACAKTILWNGPMGVFEMQAFEKGTHEILLSVIEATQKGAVSIIGGGDSATAVEKWNSSSQISHVSTGGGASLELLEGKDLPGILALSDATF